MLIARHGVEWFNNNVAGYILREAPRVDECWFSDHHIFDAVIKVWDTEKGKWVPVRPWLTAWMDWGSLTFHGVHIRALSPNRDAIERALKQAVVKNGNRPPMHLYIDNGKDYTACLNDDDKSRISSISSLLGCQVHFAIPYKARAKVIERIFGIVCVQFSKLWESYRGSTPEKRPVEADDAWKHPERLPTLDQFAAAFEQWLAAVYNRHPSQGEILKGQCPDEVRRHVQPLREPLDAQAIYKAFLRELPGPRKIGRGGMVRGLNRWYRGEVLWQALGRINEVRVKIDPDDVSTAWVYTADGRELGPVREVQRLPALIAGTENETPQNIEALRSEMALQAHQRKEAKAQSAANRGLLRFPSQPKDNATQVFQLPEAAPDSPKHLTDRTYPSNRSLAPATAAEQALAAELDDALRADTAERLGADGAAELDAGGFDELTAGDAELLALIEAEQAAKV